MMIISLVSQKGGVGKTALARLLAVEFVQSGWNVKLVDLDTAQGTATKWKVRRDQAGHQPEIAVEKFRTVERALKEAERFDLLILDGPAHAEQGGRVMARASDLVLMPTCYGLDDMEAQVEAAYELEQSGINPAKIWFVFCRAKGSDIEDQAVRAYLRKAHINVFEPVLQELPSIRQGHNEGRAASEIPFPKVQERAIALAQAIANQLHAKREAA
jgi:chromosome partitioning protein